MSTVTKRRKKSANKEPEIENEEVNNESEEQQEEESSPPAKRQKKSVEQESSPQKNGTGGQEEKCSILPVEALQDHGIAVADIKKLKESGYHTVSSVAVTMKRKLLQVRGFSDAKVDKLLLIAMRLTHNMGFTTGIEIEQDRKSLIKLTTGSKEFDKLLQGGVQAGEITEVYGEFGSGKSQLCHTMAVTAQLPKSIGGGEGKVVYIDTELTFRPERIRQIAERFNLDGDDVLNNIIVAKAYNTDHQVKLITEVPILCRDFPVALIIVDSVMALYRVDYTGRAELAERQNHLGQFLGKLINLADTYKMCILLTNQVTANPDGMNMFNIPKPIGGNVLAHASATRLFFRKGKDHTRRVTIVDSTMVEKSECSFELSNGGVCDAAE